MPEAVFWCSRLVSKSQNVCIFFNKIWSHFGLNACSSFAKVSTMPSMSRRVGGCHWMKLAMAQHEDRTSVTMAQCSPQPTRLLHWDGATTRWRATGWAGRKLLPAEGHTKIGNGKWKGMKGNIDIPCFKKLQNLSAFYIFLHCLVLHLLFVRQWILPTATSLGNLIWCHTIKVKPACCAKSHANFSSKTETGDVGCTPLGCAKPQR